MVFESGFVNLTAEEYFADPCEVPSLSSSIAHVLNSESPLHAHSRHPKLGGVARATTKALDNGSLSHALLLGSGKDIVVIDAADYRTKAAQTSRDEARASGKIPTLAHDFTEASNTAAVLRERFADKGIELGGRKEITALWEETATNGKKVQCRGMMDQVSLPTIYDIKSIRSAHPKICRRHVEDYGYAIQRAAYVSAVEKIHPEFVGRVDFLFVFYEIRAPYAVTPIRLRAKYRRVGERIWRRSVNVWEQCLRTGVWPDYTDGVLDLEPSPWFDRDEQNNDESDDEEEAA